MKNLYSVLIIMLVILQSSFVKAQCTPDNAINNSGGYLYPPVLPSAMANVQYNQVLSFKVPLDSDIVSGPISVHIHIDSAELTGIVGIPNGYNYQCNTPNCVWEGGTLGCALLSGISDDSNIGTHPIRVYVVSYIRIGSTPPYTYSARLDSSDYNIKILAYTGLFEVEQYTQLKAYPNPTNNNLYIEMTDIKTNDNSVEVFDMTGSRVFSKSFTKPLSYEYTEMVDLSAFSKGLYTVVLRTDEKISTKKVLRN